MNSISPTQSTCTSVPSSTITQHNQNPKHRVNWHEAAACAIEIELRDYKDMLKFYTEYILGKNSYRIDLLVIRKLYNQSIPKNIARIFKTYNLFEFKGIHSSLTTNSYYKTIGYAGLLINHLYESELKSTLKHDPSRLSDQETRQVELEPKQHKREAEQFGSASGLQGLKSKKRKPQQYSALNVTLTFLTFRYPRKLIYHLTKERNLTVAKTSEGIYHISIETFDAQIIVTKELPPEENLYLACLSNNLADTGLVNRLADDYSKNLDQDIYIKYMNQLTTANMQMEGESPMICEGILNLCGTSSEEIIARTRKESAAQIKELSASVEQLSSQNEHLKDLLRQNNISFE